MQLSKMVRGHLTEAGTSKHATAESWKVPKGPQLRLRDQLEGLRLQRSALPAWVDGFEGEACNSFMPQKMLWMWRQQIRVQ